MPSSLPLSPTGSTPQFVSAISCAAFLIVSSGEAICRSLLMISLTCCMGVLLFRSHRLILCRAGEFGKGREHSRLIGYQKLGSMLCCAQRSRASSVVTNGFLLTCTSRDDPVLSLWMMGEPPGIMASLGI